MGLVKNPAEVLDDESKTSAGENKERRRGRRVYFFSTIFSFSMGTGVEIALFFALANSVI